MSNSIKSQFIERDLFNASNLNEIQWRMDQTGFTKEQLAIWMRQNKVSIDNLIKDIRTRNKFKLWFDLESFEENVTDLQIDTFINANYNSIFR